MIEKNKQKQQRVLALVLSLWLTAVAQWYFTRPRHPKVKGLSLAGEGGA